MINSFDTKEFEYIKLIMSVFYNTTQLSCHLIDETGQVLLREGETSKYCNKLQHLSGDDNMCQYAHLQASHQANKLGEAYISYCPAGMVHYSVAITTGEVFRGAIIAGPVHLSEPDVYEVDQIVNRLHIIPKYLGILKKYYHFIPEVSPNTARFQLELLTILSKDIVDNTRAQLQKKKASFDKQRKLSEKVQELKEIESLAVTQAKGYPIDLEKKLSSAIIKGDEVSGKALLNELLGYIFFKYQGDNQKIISMTMDLVVVMSRAAIEGGARYEDVTEVTHEMYFLLDKSGDIEAVCVWLQTVLEKIILFVFPMDTEKRNNIGLLRKAIIFINQNLHEEITLEDVANSINLSSTYFSRLFSKEMDMTYIEYLTKIRVEESKKYLVDSQQSISDISFKMGFSDQSYFSKVFKKVEGITPGKYRKMYL